MQRSAAAAALAVGLLLAQLSRCLSPCDGSTDAATYAAEVAGVRQSLLADPRLLVAAVTERMASLAEQQRYEDAAAHRDRLGAFLRGTARSQRLSSLTQCRQLVAGRRGREADGWEVHVVRFGRLAAAGILRPGSDAADFVAGLVSAAETVVAGPGPAPAASAAETEAVLRWLETEGVRLIEVDGVWSCPVDGAGRHLQSLESAVQARTSLVPFDERRELVTVHQPPR